MMNKRRAKLFSCLLMVACLAGVSLPRSWAQNEKVLSLNSLEGIKNTMGDSTKPELKVIKNGTDGALELSATSSGKSNSSSGSHYFGIMVPLGKTWNFANAQLAVDARSTQPQNTAAFYVRAYNKGETKPCLSFSSWSNPLTADWKTFHFQEKGLGSSLDFEAAVVEDRRPTNVDRIEFIIGTRETNVPIDLQIDNLRTLPPVIGLSDLAAPKKLMRAIPVVENDNSATILYPDSAEGKAAAAQIAKVVQEKTGVTLKMRPGTAADREFEENVILLGNVFNNPAMLLLYAREFTPVDAICPGDGGYILQTVADPFGNGHGAILLGASDDVGLKLAVSAFASKINNSAFAAKVLSFPKFFEAKYSDELKKRYPWVTEKPGANTVSDGLKRGQDILDTGKHTSIAGLLRDTALRYQLTENSDQAQLFVALWDMYAKSAVNDPSKMGGGMWGFDSDFPSYEVVCGWDNIEEDPALTDEQRLHVTQEMARWLREAVVPKASMTPGRVAFNHQTFPALGVLRAGLYFTEGYPDVMEGAKWLEQADRVFKNQEKYFKSNEDCNTYQWLTDGHMMCYATARPDLTVFENGNAERISNYAIGTMNNLGYQVPYGDTGAWTASTGEQSTLNAVTFITGNKAALWATSLKQDLRKSFSFYNFQQSAKVAAPAGFDGVKLWPLEPAYANTFPEDPRPADNQLFDKISFRKSFDENSSYLLLDGLNNGGHGHRDGNSLEQLTQFGRIWLADNDYFKSQVKYHNSMQILRDGKASALPSYVALLGHGDSQHYGYSHTQLANYSGADWDRYVIWLKDQDAYLVLDKVTAQEAGEFQCRLLWHGVGAAKLTDDGMLLTQKGPSMWFQVAQGPKLSLINDGELGKSNWNGYKYADPVVRSLDATARVRLDKGQQYLFASVFHGQEKGDAPAWKLNFLQGYNGVQLASGDQTIDVQLKENSIEFNTIPGKTVFIEPQSVDASKSTFTANAPAPKVTLAPAISNLQQEYKAPIYKTDWSLNPAPKEVLLTGNMGQPGAVQTAAVLSSDPAPQPNGNVLIASSNELSDLLKNSPVMFPLGQTVKLVIDLHQQSPLSKIQWQQWWASTSSKGTSYLLDHAEVEISNDNFVKDIRKLGTVQGGSHADWGAPINYEMDATGQTARYVRITFVPKTGSSIYLASLTVTGRASSQAVSTVPFTYTKMVMARLHKGAPKILLVSTAEGTLLAVSPQGKVLWSKAFPTQLNDVAAGDVDGDGIDEIAVARQDGKTTLLDSTGKELWSQQLAFYRESPYINLVRMGDLDGDGKSEVVIGSQNWRFYMYNGAGKELWQYETVHASTSGAIADLDGDGKKEVLAGTHYYTAWALSNDGKLLWGKRFTAPICYDIATGNFDGNKTRGVIFGGGDGIFYYNDSKGNERMQYDTGDEVKHVATVDLDGDGIDEMLATSDNGYLYCFGADSNLRWLRQLGNPATALVTMPINGKMAAVAGTRNGAVYAFDAKGDLIHQGDQTSPIAQMTADGDTLLVSTDDGRIMSLTP